MTIVVAQLAYAVNLFTQIPKCFFVRSVTNMLSKSMRGNVCVCMSLFNYILLITYCIIIININYYSINFN